MYNEAGTVRVFLLVIKLHNREDFELWHDVYKRVKSLIRSPRPNKELKPVSTVYNLLCLLSRFTTPHHKDGFEL